MAYLCLECYETYQMHLPYCPKTSCHGEIIEVDDLMLPVIMLLNQRGYYTEFCCSGHVYEGSCYPYVAFSSFFNQLLNEKEFNELFKELPEPWHIENGTQNMRILRCKIENGTMFEVQKAICEANLRLLEFVNMLPSLLCDEEDNDEEMQVGIIYE